MIKKIDWSEGKGTNTKGSHNYVVIPVSKMSEVMNDNVQGANLVAFKSTFVITDITDPANPVIVGNPTIQQLQDGINENIENFSFEGVEYTVLKFPMREKYKDPKNKKGSYDGFDTFLDKIKEATDPEWTFKILTQMDYIDFKNEVILDEV